MKILLKSSLVVAIGLVLCGGQAFAHEVVKVLNRTGGTVRVKVWSGVAVKVKTLERGKSFTWKRLSTRDYNAQVFLKEGRFLKVWKRKSTRKGIDYSSDLVITGKHTITPTRPRHMMFVNESQRAIVVKLYSAKDRVQLVAQKKLTIQPGKRVSYKSVSRQFTVKVFELRDGLNRLLAAKTDVPRPATVTFARRSGEWKIDVRR